jgi:hypothetical protein
MNAVGSACRRLVSKGGLALMAAVAVASCDVSTPTGPTGRTSDSMLTYARPAGPFVGAESGRFTRPNAIFETYVRDNRNAVDVMVRSIDGDFCHLALAAPRGRALSPGTYADAARYPFQNASHPGLSFGCGHACNTLQGQFVIHSLEFGQDGDVERLRATFEQSCLRWDGVREVPMERLTGEIRIVGGSTRS